jgi:hypothetical protein
VKTGRAEACCSPDWDGREPAAALRGATPDGGRDVVVVAASDARYRFVAVKVVGEYTPHSNSMSTPTSLPTAEATVVTDAASVVAIDATGVAGGTSAGVEVAAAMISPRTL